MEHIAAAAAAAWVVDPEPSDSVAFRVVAAAAVVADARWEGRSLEPVVGPYPAGWLVEDHFEGVVADPAAAAGENRPACQEVGRPHRKEDDRPSAGSRKEPGRALVGDHRATCSGIGWEGFAEKPH